MKLLMPLKAFIKNKKNMRKTFVSLQMMNIFYSLNGVLIKTASIFWEKQGLFSPLTCFLLFLALFTLAIYAIIWQKILSRVELSVAYMNKGMIVFWGLFWAFLFFGEKISVQNILGSIIIFLGTILVMKHE